MSMTVATRACIVRESIANGYGVEDIAVMYRIPVAGVRFEVKQLRESGAFKHLFPSSKTLQTPIKSGTNETSRSGVDAPSPALDIRTCRGGPTMPVEANITARGDSASGQSNSWKSIGQIARELAEKHGGAS